MPRLVPAAAFALASLAVAAAQEPAAALKAISGRWVVESATLSGTDATALLKAYVLTLDGAAYSLEDNGRFDKGTIAVDAGKTPHQLDITGGPDSPFKGKTFPCIYKIADDKLTVCYGMDFKTRPADFTAAKDSNRMLAVYVRKN